MIKKVFKWVGISLLVLIALLIAIPYFFKSQILEAVKTEINKQLNAKVDFKDADLSLIWTFPSFNFQLKGLTVTGMKEFEGLKLADMENFNFSLDLWSVFSGNYVINGVEIDQASFYVKVLNNGKANYDLVKSDGTSSPTDTSSTPASSEPSAFKLNLSYYAFKRINVVYDDAPGDMFLSIRNLNHSGSGDFSSSNYDIYTKTKIDSLTFAYGGIKYLNKANIEAIFNANIENATALKIKFLDNKFRLNDLNLNFEGEVGLPNEKDITLDLKFNSPDTKFSSILSLIPAAYSKDFKDVKTSGQFNFSGFAKGTYNDKKLPAFGLDLGVENAQFQYPSLPMAVNEINAKVKINSPSENFDQMAIDVDKFGFKLGANPFNLTLKLRTPISDPDIDATAKGKIDLADLQKAYPLEGTQLSGIINADIIAKTKLSFVTNAQYDRVNMRGLLGVDNMNYSSVGIVPVKIKQLLCEFTPNNVNLQNFELQMGKSDLKASGVLDNILTYFSGDKIMQGKLTIFSNLMDINEIMGTSSSTTASSNAPTATDMRDTTTSAAPLEKPFDKFNFAAQVQMNKIVYDVYEITNLTTTGSFSPSVADLSAFKMNLGQTDINANGKLENIFPYLFDGATLKGNFNLNSNYINLNQLMRTDGQATEPAPAPAPTNPETAPVEYEPIQVPHNLDLRFTSNIATLIYDVYKLKNAKCDIIVRDQKVEVVNLSSNFLGGLVAFSGEYNSKDIKKPSFAFAYDISKIDFAQTAQTVFLVKKMLPFLDKVQGKFDSKFKINGILGKNMFPDLASLSADGLIVTYDAVLNGLSGLKTLADKTKVKELQNVILTNTKNFFTIKNGRFELQPFATTVKGMDLLFNGSHGLDNSLAYKMKLRVPKALLDKNPVGGAANSGLAALQGEASKLGIDLNTGEFINFGIDIGGTMTNPDYKVKLLGVEGKGGKSLQDQAQETLKAEADKLKAEAEAKARAEADKAKAEAEKLKAEAEAKAKAEAEKLKAEAEKARAAAEAKAKAEAEKLRAEADRLRKEAETKSKAEADKLKAEAERLRKEAEQKLKDKYNPFKKG